MTWLASLPAGVLVVGWLLVAVARASAGALVRVVVPVAERDQVHGIASPLMPALGATFAVLMALTLASEAGYLRTAQDLVSNEAAQASRLAWTATSPASRRHPIQTALVAYLDATGSNEWHAADAAEDSDPATSVALASLERVVRGEAARHGVARRRRMSCLRALDAVTSARRARLAAAARDFPPCTS